MDSNLKASKIPSNNLQERFINKENNITDDEEFKLNPNNKKLNNNLIKENEEVFSSKEISFLRLFDMADSNDILMMTMGTIFSILLGTLLPTAVIFLGDMTKDLSPNSGKNYMNVAKKMCSIYLIQGTLAGIFAYLGKYLWVIAGEKQSNKFRKAYFKALLRQEIAWFDVINPHELNSKVSDDCGAIQRAFGEKFSDLIFIISMTVSG